MRQAGERRESRLQQRIRSSGAFVVVAHRGDTFAQSPPPLASANGKGQIQRGAVTRVTPKLSRPLSQAPEEDCRYLRRGWDAGWRGGAAAVTEPAASREGLDLRAVGKYDGGNHLPGTGGRDH